MRNAISVRIPELDLGDTPLRIAVWHLANRRAVREGDPLVEINGGEVVVDLLVPADGILHKLVPEDEPVTVGQHVATIHPEIREP